MKQKAIVYFFLLSVPLFYGCKSNSEVSEFKHQSYLDSLSKGQIDFGNSEVNKGIVSYLNFQKKFKTGEKNGVVIHKSLINQAINGFTNQGIVIPKDTSNYNKWDFLVVYPGLEIDESGEEKNVPCVFFYKGIKDNKGNLIPGGKPIFDLKFIGGGGGGGAATGTTPPPKGTPTP